VRLRPAFKGGVWSYDFVAARTRDGRAFRLLVIIDEFSRECLAVYVARRITSDDVLRVLARLFVEKGAPCHLRSDNGPEFTAKVVREWLTQARSKDPVHRARESLGERLRRVVQWQAQGRAVEPGELRHAS
jgi:transposase InsO family protein